MLRFHIETGSITIPFCSRSLWRNCWAIILYYHPLIDAILFDIHRLTFTWNHIVLTWSYDHPHPNIWCKVLAEVLIYTCVKTFVQRNAKPVDHFSSQRSTSNFSVIFYTYVCYIKIYTEQNVFCYCGIGLCIGYVSLYRGYKSIYCNILNNCNQGNELFTLDYKCLLLPVSVEIKLEWKTQMAEYTVDNTIILSSGV